MSILPLLNFQVMLDTVGPELQVVNSVEKSISLKQDDTVILTPFRGQDATPELLPINFDGLAKVSNLISPPYLEIILLLIKIILHCNCMFNNSSENNY